MLRTASNTQWSHTRAHPAVLHTCMQVGSTLRLGGWVKTGREAGAGAFAFLEVNDGSCFDSLQARWHSCACQASCEQRPGQENIHTMLQIVLLL